MAENQTTEQEEELSEIEIAELANKELKSRDAEIAKLKKELAQAKLYSTVDGEEEEPMSREECIKVLASDSTTNYDYAQAVINLVDLELAEGNPNPLGQDGQEVYDFFKGCIEECGDDKSRFTSIYQSRLGADDKSVAMAFNKRNNKK